MASWTRKPDIPIYETAELIISGIIPIVLIVVGTIGNGLAVCILLSRENRRVSTNVYLIFLCVVDTISLYQWNLNNAMYTFTEGREQVWSRSLILCRLSEFFAFYTLHTSAMFLTFVELDRACLLRSSWYKRKVARARVAFGICISILLILFGLNGFLFVIGTEFLIFDSSGQLQTVIIACYYTLDVQMMNFFAITYPWIHLVVMYFLPFSTIILCTLFTVRKLVVHYRAANDQFNNSAQRNRRISIMLLLMCLTYVISTLPNRLCFSVFADQLVGYDYTDTVFLATNTLMYTRNAVNVIFLYFSVHGFRREIRNLFLKCLGKHIHAVAPTQTVNTLPDGHRLMTSRPVPGTDRLSQTVNKF